MNQDHVEDEAGPIKAAMHRTVGDLHPQSDQLAATARSRGRTMRRRRAALAMFAGSVLLTVGAVGGMQLATTPADGPPAVSPDDRRPDAPTSRWWSQTSTQMERRVERLLPANTTIDSTGAGPSDPRTGFLRAKVSNAMTGAGALTIRLVSPAEAQQLSCPAAVRRPDSCEINAAGDGTRVRTWHRTLGELQMLRVDVAVEGDGQVQVAAANSLDDVWDRTAEVWGPEPSLAVDDLLAIAQSPTWQGSRQGAED